MHIRYIGVVFVTPIAFIGLLVMKLLIQILFVFIFTLVANLTIASDASEQPKKSEVSWVYSAEATFNEVKDDLILAIESKGAVVSYTAHASDMLDRTAVALGIKEKVYHKAEVLLFCKAELSHTMVKNNPHDLLLCPYPIAIYSLTSDPEVTYLTIQAPIKGVQSYQAIHKLLVEIITETLDF